MTTALTIEQAIVRVKERSPGLSAEDASIVLEEGIKSGLVKAEDRIIPDWSITRAANDPRRLSDSLRSIDSQSLKAFLDGRYQPPVSAGTTSRKGIGGAPRQYDWDSFFVEIIALASHPDGLPETQAELEKHMLAWCVREWGKEPGLSTIQDKITLIYNRLRNPGN